MMNDPFSSPFDVPRRGVWLFIGLLVLSTTPTSAQGLELRPIHGSALLESGNMGSSNRNQILQLLSLYAHLYDDYETETWAKLFTKEATFEIAYTEGDTHSQIRMAGRKQILDTLQPRRERFRAEGIHRRHHLSNLLVYEHTADSARVAAYLLLTRTGPDGEVVSETTGRYDGRVVKTQDGWRIQAWRFTPDGAPIKLEGTL
ncbi:MAG: hypothetical protein CL917_04815 [Deltaproteobacteria bacterium]|nr:hypothetical protein [Deltaproteobacteria bacterium]